jgi:hypothetical protein
MYAEVCLAANKTNTRSQSWPEPPDANVNPPPSPNNSVTMRFALFAGLASLVSSVTATALTYKLEANEKACFFTNVDQSNAKVAFYFAVRPIDFPTILRLSRISFFNGLGMHHGDRPLTLCAAGPIRRILRCRLHRHCTGRQDRPRRNKGAPG